MKQPDKLFREKLQNHSMPAPDNAWQKIEGNLQSKYGAAFWLKIAAVIVPLAVIALVLTTNEKTETLADNSREQQPPTKDSSEFQNDVITEPTVAENTTPAQRSKNGKKDAVKKITPVVESEIKTEILVAENTTTQITVEIITETSVAVAETKPNSKTLVYTAAEVNQKFMLAQKPADATAEDEKASSLQTLLGKASDLKNNQAPLAELRQMKNEFLAFNHRSDERNKKREQKN